MPKQVSFALFFAAALLVLLFSPLKLRFCARQRGFSAKLGLQICAVFGLLRLPLRFLIEFDIERVKKNLSEAKCAFSLFRITRSGKRKQIQPKRKKPEKAKLPVFPIIKAISLRKLELGGELALDDAAACVLLCGTLNGCLPPILTIILDLLPLDARRARIRAAFLPKFTENAVCLDFEGIVKSNMAKLIKGLLSALITRSANMRKEPGVKATKNHKQIGKGENSCIPLKT